MEYKGFDPKYDDTKKANEIIFGKLKYYLTDQNIGKQN